MLPTNISMQLERNMPTASAQTNKTALGTINFANRNYKLAHKVNPGGFENKGGMPQIERAELVPSLNPNKYELQTKMQLHGNYGN